MVFNDRLVILLLFSFMLGLIKTLFSPRIQDLFGSKFGFTSKGFWVSFISEPNQSTRVDPLGLIFQQLFKLM